MSDEQLQLPTREAPRQRITINARLVGGRWKARCDLGEIGHPRPAPDADSGEIEHAPPLVVVSPSEYEALSGRGDTWTLAEARRRGIRLELLPGDVFRMTATNGTWTWLLHPATCDGDDDYHVGVWPD